MMRSIGYTYISEIKKRKKKEKKKRYLNKTQITLLLFSTRQSRPKKTREDYYNGLLFSTGQSPLKKTREDYSGLLFSTAVRFVWRIAPKHLMTMTQV